jgi:hypothetical protein
MIKYLMLLIFLSGCSTSYIAIADRVTENRAKRICKEEKLYLVGAGGAMMDEITKVSLRFDAYRRVDINEARRLCVRCVEEIRQGLNATGSLQPYLKPYPFPASSMEVGIMFLKNDDSFVDYGCAYLGTGGVTVVHQVAGMLCYSSFNPRTELLEPYYEESYEDALTILKSQEICSYDSP